MWSSTAADGVFWVTFGVYPWNIVAFSWKKKNDLRNSYQIGVKYSCKFLWNKYPHASLQNRSKNTTALIHYFMENGKCTCVWMCTGIQQKIIKFHLKNTTLLLTWHIKLVLKWKMARVLMKLCSDERNNKFLLCGSTRSVCRHIAFPGSLCSA